MINIPLLWYRHTWHTETCESIFPYLLVSCWSCTWVLCHSNDSSQCQAGFHMELEDFCWFKKKKKKKHESWPEWSRTVATYKNGSGRSMAILWTKFIESELEQIILDNDIFRISLSWASEKRTKGSLVSCQNRSHFRNLWNWRPMTHPNVGPTEPPWRGFSISPPVKMSMSSTCLTKIKGF